MTASSLRLPRFGIGSRFVAMAKFLFVGVTGVAVNELLFVGFTERLGVSLALAALLATQGSTTWNFIGNERWAFRGRSFAGRAWVRYLGYSAMNNASLVLRVPMLWVLTDIHVNAAWGNLITLVLLFAIRFALSDGLIWRTKAVGLDGQRFTSAPGQPLYRYDISGIVRLHSDAELPELAYFRTSSDGTPDLRIRIARVGSLPAGKVKLVRDGDRVTYREHLGVLGANFNVRLGDPIEVEVAPLLALSRHVLYTNVVEALLRFVLVSKGYVLLHSAGMDVNGNATLLSARTDTGKTSTVIKLVRERNYRFISDDMTIVDPAGFVRPFPKPMTLSYHTMVRSVESGTLGRRRLAQLQVQSRVHSKSGRSVGKGLGTMNVPIMSINSVVQLVVPPPKYHITSLLPAEISDRARITNVFLMERGEPIQEPVDLEAAVDQLIENTDDAYGFPPFASLAPQLEIAGADYAALRARERELLTSALQRASIWRLRVRGYEWGELLPGLMEGSDERIAVQIVEADRIGIPIEPEHDGISVGGQAAAELAELAAMPERVSSEALAN